MNLRRAVFIAACMFVVTAGPAAAQSPWPQPQQPAAAPWPQQQQPAAAPWPQQQQPAEAPWPQQQQQQQSVVSPWSAQPQQVPPCVQQFGKLRDDAQRKAHAIQVTMQRRPSAKEACALFNAFSAAEAKMIKYATENAVSCHIPPEVLTTLKKGHARTTEIRTRACQAAAAPPQPAAPTLSDALNAPIIDSSDIKTGGGTFDTLTGAPLGK
jgi:hypothetical protein